MAEYKRDSRAGIQIHKTLVAEVSSSKRENQLPRTITEFKLPRAVSLCGPQEGAAVREPSRHAVA